MSCSASPSSGGCLVSCNCQVSGLGLSGDDPWKVLRSSSIDEDMEGLQRRRCTDDDCRSSLAEEALPVVKLSIYVCFPM